MSSQALLPWRSRHSGRRVQTVICSLPGRASSAVALVHGTYWYLVDPEKTDGVAEQLVRLLG